MQQPDSQARARGANRVSMCDVRKSCIMRSPFSVASDAAEISKQTGRHSTHYLPPDDYVSVPLGFGLPEPISVVVVGADIKSTQGGLDGAGSTLSTPWVRKTISPQRDWRRINHADCLLPVWRSRR